MRTNTIVSDEAIEAALTRLADLDDIEAELRAAKEFGEEQKKVIFSERYNDADGTNGEREAIARVSGAYQKHLKDLREVSRKSQRARNERERLMMIVDVWRSEQANQRQRT